MNVHYIKSVYLAILLYTFPTSASFAQRVALVVQGVEENRNIGFSSSKLVVYAKFTGLPVDERHQIRLKEIRFSDNLGNALKSLNEYPYQTRYFSQERDIALGIHPPARQAQRISMNGTIEYFTISQELESECLISDLSRQFYKNLLADASVQAELRLLDLAGLKALRDEDEDAYRREVEGLFENAGVYLDRALEDYAFFSQDRNHSVLYFYKTDPEDELVEIRILDSAGKEIGENSFSNEYSYGIRLEEALTAEAILRIIVKTEDSVTDIPFQIKNVKLP